MSAVERLEDGLETDPGGTPPRRGAAPSRASAIETQPTERSSIGNPLVPQLNRLKAAFEQ